MAGTRIHVLLFALLIALHFIHSCRGADTWNPGPMSLIEADKKLRELPLQYCKDMFDMKAPQAIELLKRNLPATFSLFNEKPRGCVEIQIQIDETRTDPKSGTETIVKTWNVEVDADCQTDTQMPHFGYTVDAILNDRKQAAFTGHVWLYDNPPNCRPWKSKGKVTHFADETQGAAKNVVFKLRGKLYNQFLTSHEEL